MNQEPVVGQVFHPRNWNLMMMMVRGVKIEREKE